MKTKKVHPGQKSKKSKTKFSTKTLQTMSEKPGGFWSDYVAPGSNMCPYDEKGKSSGLYNTRRPARRAVEVKENLGKAHRGRVTCPLCKRRLQGWVIISHDADFIRLAVPPHKRRKWWKK